MGLYRNEIKAILRGGPYWKCAGAEKCWFGKEGREVGGGVTVWGIHMEQGQAGNLMLIS